MWLSVFNPLDAKCTSPLAQSANGWSATLSATSRYGRTTRGQAAEELGYQACRLDWCHRRKRGAERVPVPLRAMDLTPQRPNRLGARRSPEAVAARNPRAPPGIVTRDRWLSIYEAGNVRDWLARTEVIREIGSRPTHLREIIPRNRALGVGQAPSEPDDGKDQGRVAADLGRCNGRPEEVRGARAAMPSCEAPEVRHRPTRSSGRTSTCQWRARLPLTFVLPSPIIQTNV